MIISAGLGCLAFLHFFPGFPYELERRPKSDGEAGDQGGRRARGSSRLVGINHSVSPIDAFHWQPYSWGRLVVPKSSRRLPSKLKLLIELALRVLLANERLTRGGGWSSRLD